VPALSFLPILPIAQDLPTRRRWISGFILRSLTVEVK
jgi:hypothetical protein